MNIEEENKMKKNTQKILLSLFTEVSTVKNRIPLSVLQCIVPELTAGGFRSLLFTLKKQGVISTQRVQGVTTASITHYGTTLLESEFPALSSKWDDWDGSWECLLFMDSPAFDKQFRYLRTLLLSEGALVVNRGVYIAPGGFSQIVLKECRNAYHSSVLLFSVGDWKIATESSFIIEKYGLLDIAEGYSGLSRDVGRLIEISISEKGLIEGNKSGIHLVYDRVVDILLEDPGFCTFYFKEVEKVKNILSRLSDSLAI